MNDRWNDDQDDVQPIRRSSWAELFPESKKRDNESLWKWMEKIGVTPVPFEVLCLDRDGQKLLALTYHPRDEELARLCFDMNKAALIENPRLLPEGTVRVHLRRGADHLDGVAVDLAEAAA